MTTDTATDLLSRAADEVCGKALLGVDNDVTVLG